MTQEKFKKCVQFNKAFVNEENDSLDLNQNIYIIEKAYEWVMNEKKNIKKENSSVFLGG